MEDAPRVETAALAARIMRRLAVMMPAINIACAVITFVFVAYVVPLPGAAVSPGIKTCNCANAPAITVNGALFVGLRLSPLVLVAVMIIPDSALL